MTSQWYTNVNKARTCHAPTWRKTFKWTHFTTISKREWISTVIVYVYEVIWSIHFHSIKWNYDNRIGESPWRSWCYLICIITHGLCSYNARLFNDDITAIGVSYWRRREFPNYARLHRGRMGDSTLCSTACLLKLATTRYQRSASLALCEGNPQRANDTEIVSMLWRHHGLLYCPGVSE